MIRRCLSTIILTCLLSCAGAAQGQQRNARDEKPATDLAASRANQSGNLVYDDDGGRVFIIGRDLGSPLADMSYHGGHVISPPRLYTIFLGDGWSSEWNKPRVAQLAADAAEAVSTDAHSSEHVLLADRGVADLSLQPDQPLDPISTKASSDSTLSDLQVQAALSDSFKSGVIGAPDQETVYTVFLPPGVMSTLGGLLGGKHYLAYHNFFHVDGVEIHYVVIPFQGNVRLTRSIVKRAIIEAILNPSGDGWF